MYCYIWSEGTGNTVGSLCLFEYVATLSEVAETVRVLSVMRVWAVSPV